MLVLKRGFKPILDQLHKTTEKSANLPEMFFERYEKEKDSENNQKGFY